MVNITNIENFSILYILKCNTKAQFSANIPVLFLWKLLIEISMNSLCLNLEIFGNIINVCTVTFDQFDVSMLNKSFSFFLFLF